jgi:hypothetical protein
MQITQVITLHTCSSQEESIAFFPKGQNYGENKYFTSFGSVHAEVDAIRKVERKYSDRIKKKNKKKFNLLVIKVSPRGTHVGNSRLCEKCVLRVYSLAQNSGIKIKNIYYSDHNGNIIRTTPTKLYNSNDHFMTSYYRNRNYKSHFQTCQPCSNESSDSDTDCT